MASNILGGLGRGIGLLFSVEPKTEDELLEEKINKALAEEREKIITSKDGIELFSWITKDNNPIHRIPKIAKELGFMDIPLMGSHVAAYGEQFIEGVVQHMREYWGADIKIIGQDNKFVNPLYPGERMLWQVSAHKVVNEGIDLSVTGNVKEKRIVGITSHLGINYFSMPQIAGAVYSRKYVLHESHLESFSDCVGGKNNGKVLNMLQSAFVPATLLRLLEEKTQTYEGINKSMNFRFISEAKPGRLQVDIFPPAEPEIVKIKNREGQRKEMFHYEFEAVVSQETKPLSYGKMNILSPRKVDFSN